MNKQEVEFAIRDCVTNDVGDRPLIIDWFDAQTVQVSPGYGMYACLRFDYDSLARLSRMLGTTNISFDGNKGWCGTEVTPGDPADMRLKIVLAKPV